VLLDANVLYSRILGDYFVQLHETGVVSVRWSSQIIDEVVKNKKEEYVAKYDDPQDLLPRLAAAEGFRTYAQQHYPKSFIEPSGGHYAGFADLHMPDPDDRHVVAAAVAARATHLCTSNAPDFPDPIMKRVGIVRVEPDALLHEHASRSPLAMVQAHQQVLLLPPTPGRPGPAQLGARPTTAYRDRQRLGQQRGVGGR
jgi:hypothetical protein